VTDGPRDRRPSSPQGHHRVNARARALGRLTLQERQKQNSRDKIIQAAKDVLAETSYAMMAVEDVISRAGVSRATFYRHFDSKFAIGKELHSQFVPSLNAIYDEVLVHVDPTEAQLIDWIERVVDFYRREKVLIVAFSHMSTIEPEFHPIMVQLVEANEQRWGQHLRAFKVPFEDSPLATAAKIESRLLQRQLNDFCFEVAIFDWDIDIKEGCRIVAHHFRSFLDRYQGALQA